MTQIRLTENRLRGIIREAVKSVLREDVAREKRFRETPQIQVKQGGQYHGRDPKGIKYNIYIDGMPMFRACMTDSEYDAWDGGKYMPRGTYSVITIYFGHIYAPYPADKFKNTTAFRKQAGFNSSNDFNFKQAQANVKEILPRAIVSNVGDFMVIENYARFTPENAPYIIYKCIEGLLSPIEKSKRKSTDEVTFYNIYDGSEQTMTLEDAYKYAVSVYKDISYYDNIRKPNEYADIEDCLNDYAEAWEKIEQSYQEPEDWYERVEHGDFDEY